MKHDDIEKAIRLQVDTEILKELTVQLDDLLDELIELTIEEQDIQTDPYKTGYDRVDIAAHIQNKRNEILIRYGN